MTNDILIKADNVSKKYCRALKHTMIYGMQDIVRNTLGMAAHSDRLRDGEFWALDDISFEVKRGECVGIIGANGSGKSTLLKLLNGIFLPDKGRIEIKGRCGALIEVGAGFHPMLTGRENVYINGAILGMSKKEIDRKFDEIVSFADIGDFIDSPVKHYSSGMYVRLGFAVAIQCEPDILLVDEVLAVGDAKFQRKCFAKMNELRQNGKTILFVSHDVNTVNQLCSETILLDHGAIVKQGNPRDITKLYHKFLFGQEEQSDKGAFQEISLTAHKEQCVTVQTGQDEFIERQKLKQYAMQKLNISDVHISSEEMRYGNKKAEIIDYGILDRNFKRVDVLKTGERYSIFFKTLFYEDLDDLTLGCRIQNTRGMDVFAANTYFHNITIPPQKKGNLLECCFDVKMHLAQGDFFLTFGIRNINSDNFYDRRIDTVHFKVESIDKMDSACLVNLDEVVSVRNVVVG